MTVTADMVTACPACDDADVQSRMTKEPKYRCANCGETFDEPVERESKIETGDWNIGGDLTEVVQRHLADEVESGESPYFKSRRVAEGVGLTSKQVGNAFTEMERRGHVEKWGSGRSGTWRVVSAPEEMRP